MPAQIGISFLEVINRLVTRFGFFCVTVYLSLSVLKCCNSKGNVTNNLLWLQNKQYQEIRNYMFLNTATNSVKHRTRQRQTAAYTSPKNTLIPINLKLSPKYALVWTKSIYTLHFAPNVPSLTRFLAKCHSTPSIITPIVCYLFFMSIQPHVNLYWKVLSNKTKYSVRTVYYVSQKRKFSRAAQFVALFKPIQTQHPSISVQTFALAQEAHVFIMCACPAAPRRCSIYLDKGNNNNQYSRCLWRQPKHSNP